MWKNSKWMRIWDVLYPVGMYLVISNIAMFFLGLFLPVQTENYNLRHCIVTLVALPFIWSYYRNVPFYCVGKTGEKKKFSLLHLLLAAVAGAAAAVTCNNLIYLTPLTSLSGSYRQVSRDFYGSALWLTILSTCVLTPVLEELLYRGVVYKRLRSWVGVWQAILWSALLFGVMHLNLVQFVYAGLLGILLAWITEHAGLWTAVAAHIAANLISILRSECGFLSFMEEGTVFFVMGTGIAALLAAGCVYVMYQRTGPLDRKKF